MDISSYWFYSSQIVRVIAFSPSREASGPPPPSRDAGKRRLPDFDEHDFGEKGSQRE